MELNASRRVCLSRDHVWRCLISFSSTSGRRVLIKSSSRLLDSPNEIDASARVQTLILQINGLVWFKTLPVLSYNLYMSISKVSLWWILFFFQYKKLIYRSMVCWLNQNPGSFILCWNVDIMRYTFFAEIGSADPCETITRLCRLYYIIYIYAYTPARASTGIWHWKRHHQQSDQCLL